MSILNKLPKGIRNQWWLATLVGGVLILSGCEAFEGGRDHDRRGDYRDRPAGYRVENDRWDHGRDRDGYNRDRDNRDRDSDRRY